MKKPDLKAAEPSSDSRRKSPCSSCTWRKSPAKLKPKSRFKKEENKKYYNTTAHSGLTAAHYGAAAINHHPVWLIEVKVEDSTFLGAMSSPSKPCSSRNKAGCKGPSARQKLFHSPHASAAKNTSLPKSALINLLQGFGVKCLNCSFVPGTTLLLFTDIY